MKREDVFRMIAFCGLVLLLSSTLSGLDLKSSKGMRLYVFQDDDALFFHAEILINLSDQSNPVVSFLTYLNIFNDEVTGGKSRVLSAMNKMGNDSVIIFGIDHIIIKINFLKDRVQQFIQLLKKISDSGNFSLKNFKYSQKNYRKLFFSEKNWKKLLAADIARKKFFMKNINSEGLIINEQALRKINLSQVRSFYKNNFNLKNITVAIKGKINPYIFLGLIEKSMRNFKQNSAPKVRTAKPAMAKERKTVIVNIKGENTGFEIFWMIPAPPKNEPGFNLLSVSNNILFGYPLGTISRLTSRAGIKNFRIDTSVCEFNDISFLCNRIKLFRQSDVRKFLFIANNSFRKLVPGRITKKEFLSSYNLIFQGEQVREDDFSYETEKRVSREFTKKNIISIPTDPALFRNENISYITFMKYIENRRKNRELLQNIRRGVIVIFGGASQLISGSRIDRSAIIRID